jgi:two-component system, NtrC family, sensor kinase
MNTPANRRILLVDDFPSIHEDFRKILCPLKATADFDADEALLFGAPTSSASIPFEMDSAFQGAEALEKVSASLLAESPYAMAFIDMRMPPGWDGVETAERLWQVDPRLQIVFCTAFSDHAWTEVLTRLDVRDRLLILKKPFDTIEVYQFANALTTKWQVTEQAAFKMGMLEEAVEERTRELEQSREALMLDIIEVQRLGRELAAAQKLEAVGRLAAGVAHEINTPVQFVSDNVQFVRTSMTEVAAVIGAYRELKNAAKSKGDVAAAVRLAEDAEKAADLDYILKDAPQALDSSIEGLGRIATIVRSMKEFAHPDRAQKTLADLNQAIRSTLVVAHNEYKHVAELGTQFGDLPAIPCFLGEINQVVLNLLVNASHAISDVVKDSGNLGKLEVRTRLDGNEVEISISDTGTGIPESARDKIFDPFFTTKEVGKGTGQGLAFARSIIVNKHGGTLRFETEYGKGTTFFIRLPIDAPIDATSDGKQIAA